MLTVRRHPIVIAAPAALALVAIVGAAVLGFVTGPAKTADPIDTIAGLVAVLATIRFVWRGWEWRVDRILVTDHRFLEVSGILTRRVATMPLTKVTDMTYRRSILGRLLGYGDLIVESAGQDQSLSRIERIPRPDAFYRTVTSLVTAVIPEAAPEHTRAWTGWDDQEDTGPLPRVIV
jgi:membrane protein YdbS with pleckstrin-like domain